MTPEIRALAQLRDWIRIKDGQHYSATRFDNLGIAAKQAWHYRTKLAIEQGHDRPPRALSELANVTTFLRQDWTNAFNIIGKLTWMHELYRSGGLESETWMYFAASDVDMWHVEMRSAYDYLSRAISSGAALRGQAPHGSFNELVAWCRAYTRRADRVFGPEQAKQIVESDGWFGELRKVRDQNVHSGAYNIVFPDKEHILFQVHTQRGSRLIVHPAVMHNENIVDFARYAAIAIARFWQLAEDASTRAWSRFGLAQVGLGEGLMSISTGHWILRQWADEAISHIRGMHLGSDANEV